MESWYICIENSLFPVLFGIRCRRRNTIVVSFRVVGVRGYASSHLCSVEALEEEGLGNLSAVVVKNPNKYKEKLAHLREKGVTISETYQYMLEIDQ